MPSRLLRTGIALAALRLVGGLIAFMAAPIIAKRFGLDPALDAFYVASSIPFVLSSIALIGGLETVVPPIFRKYSSTDATDLTDGDRGWEFVNALWPLALIVTCAVAAISFALMPRLLPLLAPGLDAERERAAIAMARVLLIAPIIAAPVGAWRGALIANNRLIGPAIIVAAGSAIYFLAVALAPALFGAWTLVAATLSASFTGILGLLIFFPRALTAQLKPRIDFRHPGLRAALALLVPLGINELVYHSDFVIMRGFATNVGPGVVAAYEFASRPVAAAITLLVAGIVTPAFPELARTANDLPAFRATLSRTLRAMVIVTVPVALAFVVLRFPIVTFLYQRGRFTAEEAALVAPALAALAPYFFLTAVVQPLAHATYARQQPLWTVVGSLIGLAFSAGGAYFLSRRFGLIGIAIADGLGAVPLAGMLIVWRLRLNREAREER